jgi:hypothetical protein
MPDFLPGSTNYAAVSFKVRVFRLKIIKSKQKLVIAVILNEMCAEVINGTIIIIS